MVMKTKTFLWALPVLAALAGAAWIAQRTPTGGALGVQAATATTETSPSEGSGAGASEESRASAVSSPAGEPKAEEKPERKLEPLPVTGVQVEPGPFVLTVRGTGRAEAVRRAELSPRVGERVNRVHVKPGDRVERGQVLVELDAEPFQWALRDAEADLARAELDFDAQLFADTAATEEKKTRVAHRTGLTRAQQDVERARLDIEGTKLRAPFSGYIAEVDVAIGERIRADEPVLTLVDLATLRIPAEVLESRFGALSPGAAVRVQFPALPGETFDGSVASLGPEVDPDRGTGTAYVELENPRGRIRPGMYADVSIEAESFADRLSVPRSAVLERNRRLLVFLAKSGRAEWSYVETGLETDASIELTSGVAPGDTVLTSGHLTLAHGAPVRVKLEH